MIIRKSEDLLIFWQEIYGQLDSTALKAKFLRHECVAEILKHRPERIEVAVRRNIKLKDILQDLFAQDDKLEEFLDKYYPYRNSQPDVASSKIEVREKEGGRWGRSF